MRWLWLLIAAGIAYGSLFPFAFDRALPAEGAVAYLLASLSSLPSRGDLVSNLVLYLPFGLVGSLALRESRRGVLVVLAVIGLGGLESLTVEFLQLFDSARSASLWDLALNMTSTAVGAVAGTMIRRERFALSDRLVLRDRFALVLIASWLAYRLAPFVPTLDLTHVRDAVKALLHGGSFAVGTCLRYAVAWLVVGIGLRTAFAHRIPRYVLPALGFATACAPMLIMRRGLVAEEFVAVALATALQPLLGPSRRSTILVLIAHAIVILAVQLEPFRFDGPVHDFSWVPFSGILRGSLDVGVFAIFEKFFLHGVAIWLPVRLGGRVATVTAIVVAVVFATELAQTRLDGRTAEIGEPMIALVAGAMCAAWCPRGRASAPPAGGYPPPP